ncbi:MAG TPA: hypothetical protein VFB16_12355 [Bauldia sp.]|nr:hypothetical protein [Bauldia sp.]
MTLVKRCLPALCGGVLMLAAVPAFAEEPGEAALRGFVADIDASPSWKASFKDLTYDPATEKATLTGLSVSAENESGVGLEVEKITLSGYAPLAGGGFAAKGFTANGVTADAGVAKVAVDDVSLSDVSFPTLQGPGYDADKPFTSMMRIYAGLLKVKLGGGRIGNLTVLEQMGDVRSRVAYENFELGPIADGKIALVKAGPLRLEAPSPEGLVTMNVGGVESRDIDLGAFIRVFDPDFYADGRGDMKWQTSLGSGVYSDIKMDVPGATVGIKSVRMENFRLRQPSESFAGFLDEVMIGMRHPEQQAEAIGELGFRALPAMLSAFGVGKFAVEGVAIQATGIDRFTLDGFHVSDLSSDGLGEIGLDGLHGAVAGEGAINIGRIAVGGIVFPTFADILAVTGRIASGDGSGMMSLFPKIGFAEAKAIDIATADIPHFALESARVDMKDYLGPLPLSVSAAVSGLEVPVAAMKPDARATFRKLGYDKLLADYRLKYAWDESKNEMAVDDLHFGLQGMGSITASAKIGGITRDLLEHFDNPTGAADLSLISAKIKLTDESIVGKGLGLLAEKMKVPPEKFRAQFADALPFLLTMSPIDDPTVMAIIRQSGILGKLAPAMKTFIATQGSLILTMLPAAPVGLPALAQAAETDPASLPGLLNLAITAEEGPVEPPKAPAPAPQ